MTDKINENSSEPLHIQAEKILRALIQKEEYQKGKFLPTEVELSQQLGISRNTLRQAINKLVFEGLLDRKKGKGTKVIRKGIVSGIRSWLSFSEEMRRLGINVNNYELHVSWRKVNPEVLNFFGREDENERYLTLERVRGNLEFPFVYFISYFNPDIPMTGNEDFTKPLYETMEKHYGVTVKKSNETLSAGLAGTEIAKKLEIDASDPILIRQRCVYDADGRPVEYNIGYYRADSFSYTVESER